MLVSTAHVNAEYHPPTTSDQTPVDDATDMDTTRIFLLTIARKRLQRASSFAGEDVPQTNGVIPRATRKCCVSCWECYTTHRTLVTHQDLTN